MQLQTCLAYKHTRHSRIPLRAQQVFTPRSRRSQNFQDMTAGKLREPSAWHWIPTPKHCFGKPEKSKPSFLDPQTQDWMMPSHHAVVRFRFLTGTNHEILSRMSFLDVPWLAHAGEHLEL